MNYNQQWINNNCNRDYGTRGRGTYWRGNYGMPIRNYNSFHRGGSRRSRNRPDIYCGHSRREYNRSTERYNQQYHPVQNEQQQQQNWSRQDYFSNTTGFSSFQLFQHQPVKPPSPLPGSEEFMLRDISEKSALLKQQLELEKLAPSNKNSANCQFYDASDTNSTKSSLIRNQCNSDNVAEQNIDAKTKTETVPPRRLKRQRQSKPELSVQEIHDKIIKHISNLSYDKKINLVNQTETSEYDLAIQQITLQKRVELSKVLRDMCNNKFKENKDSSNVINAIIPDFDIKIEELPREFVEQLSSTLNEDIEERIQNISIDPEAMFQQAANIINISLNNEQKGKLNSNGKLDVTDNSANIFNTYTNTDDSSFYLKNSHVDFGNVGIQQQHFNFGSNKFVNTANINMQLPVNIEVSSQVTTPVSNNSFAEAYNLDSSTNAEKLNDFTNLFFNPDCLSNEPRSIVNNNVFDLSALTTETRAVDSLKEPYKNKLTQNTSALLQKEMEMKKTEKLMDLNNHYTLNDEFHFEQINLDPKKLIQIKFKNQQTELVNSSTNKNNEYSPNSVKTSNNILLSNRPTIKERDVIVDNKRGIKTNFEKNSTAINTSSATTKQVEINQEIRTNLDGHGLINYQNNLLNKSHSATCDRNRQHLEMKSIPTTEYKNDSSTYKSKQYLKEIDSVEENKCDIWNQTSASNVLENSVHFNTNNNEITNNNYNETGKLLDEKQHKDGKQTTENNISIQKYEDIWQNDCNENSGPYNYFSKEVINHYNTNDQQSNLNETISPLFETSSIHYGNDIHNSNSTYAPTQHHRDDFYNKNESNQINNKQHKKSHKSKKSRKHASQEANVLSDKLKRENENELAYTNYEKPLKERLQILFTSKNLHKEKSDSDHSCSDHTFPLKTIPSYYKQEQSIHHKKSDENTLQSEKLIHYQNQDVKIPEPESCQSEKCVLSNNDWVDEKHLRDFDQLPQMDNHSKIYSNAENAEVKEEIEIKEHFLTKYEIDNYEDSLTKMPECKVNDLIDNTMPKNTKTILDKQFLNDKKESNEKYDCLNIKADSLSTAKQNNQENYEVSGDLVVPVLEKINYNISESNIENVNAYNSMSTNQLRKQISTFSEKTKGDQLFDSKLTNTIEMTEPPCKLAKDNDYETNSFSVERNSKKSKIIVDVANEGCHKSNSKEKEILHSAEVSSTSDGTKVSTSETTTAVNTTSTVTTCSTPIEYFELANLITTETENVKNVEKKMLITTYTQTSHIKDEKDQHHLSSLTAEKYNFDNLQKNTIYSNICTQTTNAIYKNIEIQTNINILSHKKNISSQTDDVAIINNIAENDILDKFKHSPKSRKIFKTNLQKRVIKKMLEIDKEIDRLTKFRQNLYNKLQIGSESDDSDCDKRNAVNNQSDVYSMKRFNIYDKHKSGKQEISSKNAAGQKGTIGKKLKTTHQQCSTNKITNTDINVVKCDKRSNNKSQERSIEVKPASSKEDKSKIDETSHAVLFSKHKDTVVKPKFKEKTSFKSEIRKSDSDTFKNLMESNCISTSKLNDKTKSSNEIIDTTKQSSSQSFEEKTIHRTQKHKRHTSNSRKDTSRPLKHESEKNNSHAEVHGPIKSLTQIHHDNEKNVNSSSTQDEQIKHVHKRKIEHITEKPKSASENERNSSHSKSMLKISKSAHHKIRKKEKEEKKTTDADLTVNFENESIKSKLPSLKYKKIEDKKEIKLSVKVTDKILKTDNNNENLHPVIVDDKSAANTILEMHTFDCASRTSNTSNDAESIMNENSTTTIKHLKEKEVIEKVSLPIQKLVSQSKIKNDCHEDSKNTTEQEHINEMHTQNIQSKNIDFANYSIMHKKRKRYPFSGMKSNYKKKKRKSISSDNTNKKSHKQTKIESAIKHDKPHVFDNSFVNVTRYSLVQLEEMKETIRTKKTDQNIADPNTNVSLINKELGIDAVEEPSIFTTSSVDSEIAVDKNSVESVLPINSEPEIVCNKEKYTDIIPKKEMHIPSMDTSSHLEPNDEGFEGFIKENINSNDATDCSPQEKPLDQQVLDNKTSEYEINFTGFTGTILVIKVISSTVIAASDKGKVFCFNLLNGELNNVFEVSKLPITSMVVCKRLETNVIYTGSLDSCLGIINFDNNEVVKQEKVIEPIQCMEHSWNCIYIGSDRGSLIRFELDSEKVVDEIKISDFNVLMIKATQEGPRKVLVIATRNAHVCIRDANSGLLLRMMETPFLPTVYTVLTNKNLIYCGTSQHDILVFTFEDGQLIFKHEATKSKGVVCMEIVGNLLFAGCYNGNVYVYNTKTNVHLGTMNGPGGLLLSMKIVADKIIVGTKSNNFKAWRIPMKYLDDK